MSDPASPPPRAALSRDFSEFLVELSIALHKHAMYPSGHPSLGPASEAVTRHAERLLESRDLIAFGVARQQLIIEGVATDPQQPVLRRLAEGLHRHHLGAVSLLRGIQPREVSTALRALAADADRDGPIGLLSGGQLPDCPHLRLHPLTFDGLALVGDAPMAEGGGGGAGGVRSAELWVGLARAAMAGDAPERSDASVPTEPSVVAQAIDKHHGAQAYDQVIVGYLLQIASELRTATGAEAEALRRRTARLISALKPETLRRLVEMGGDVGQRNAFVLNATHGMAIDAVLEIVKAAADASGQTISHGLVRMLSKLSAHAELGGEQVKPLADAALREQIEKLLSEWQLADPNPEEYGQMLQYLATTAPGHAARGAAGGEREALRLVQMSFEVGASGPLVDRAIGTCLSEGALGSLIDAIEHAPPASVKVVDRVRARLAQPAAIGMLAAREPLDEASLDYLLPHLSADGYGVLLDALTTSQSRTARRKLLDRLGRASVDIGGLVVARLADDRWYVQRNMLVLLERIGQMPAGFSVLPWVTHADARVRYEAIRLQLSLPQDRHQAVHAALHDSDPRVVRLGLSTVQDECPPDLVRLLARVAHSSRMSDELRLLAVQSLAQSGERSALEVLLPFVDGGKNFFGRSKLAPKTPLAVAALRGLAGRWRAEPRARTLIALAAASPDDDLRGAAREGRS